MIWLFPVGLFCGVLVYQHWREWRYEKSFERSRDTALVWQAMDQLTDEELAERLR